MFVEDFSSNDIKFAIPQGYELDNMNKEKNYIELCCSKTVEKDVNDEEVEQPEFYYSKLYDFKIVPNTFFSNTEYQKAMIKKLGEVYQEQLKEHYQKNHIPIEKFNNLCRETNKPMRKQTSLFDF